MDLDEDRYGAAVARRAFSGVVAVDRGEVRLLRRAEGLAHRAAQVPVTPRTRFAVASGTKAFTALAVMRLVEDGVLTLDTPVRTFLGADLPLVDDDVTVEHLLTHTSGIGDYLDEEHWDPHDHVLRQPVHVFTSAEAFVAELDGHAQVAPPGRRFAYNNGAYVVLALVAERASGRPYHELVRTEVCDRAELRATGFLRSDALPGDTATGYLEDDGPATNVLHLPVLGVGDGGIYTTADDLHAFWRALFAGRIVAPDTVAAMTRPRHDVPAEGLRSAMGFWRRRTGRAVLIEGYDAGVSFRSTHDPLTGTTVSVLGNSSEGAWPVIDLVAELDDEAPEDDDPA
ncbi:serine hydrolase domain-containing protein [Isoptericola chiayiensis]|uniref:Serine hydrolase domain-containing protein n=1 Tax=Isoptericola chiayiensis TaxID=579446 RepID=A0ABP8YLD9_9MICO|nr:serine hydrolase domain-containing protein [Isoptericola chiayiensis]NOV99677.1 CubicO group peptidase (beta-lactamase class C family) [Isoptericola chiayiensis]